MTPYLWLDVSERCSNVASQPWSKPSSSRPMTFATAPRIASRTARGSLPPFGTHPRLASCRPSRRKERTSASTAAPTASPQVEPGGSLGLSFGARRGTVIIRQKRAKPANCVRRFRATRVNLSRCSFGSVAREGEKWLRNFARGDQQPEWKHAQTWESLLRTWAWRARATGWQCQGGYGQARRGCGRRSRRLRDRPRCRTGGGSRIECSCERWRSQDGFCRCRFRSQSPQAIALIVRKTVVDCEIAEAHLAQAFAEWRDDQRLPRAREENS
jgi:hypothetical protein